MAQPQLGAQFFCSPTGDVIPRAPQLKESLKRQIYARDGFVCSLCREPVRRGGKYDSPFDRGPKSGSIDHIFPRARGGQNVPENLRVVCRACNCSKGAT